jgi:hypothetical protein
MSFIVTRNGSRIKNGFVLTKTNLKEVTFLEITTYFIWDATYDPQPATCHSVLNV